MTANATTDVVSGPDLSAWVSAESYWHPRRLVLSAWLGHAPFAFWIMNAVRPATLVELGTHNGFSFFTFCEAARRLRLDTRCFALDTWQGDDHAGFYGEEIFADVDGVRAESYPDMAVLLRGYFDESVEKFDDGSVDLLHIDGRHGYEDVKHDFESWLPKVSESGIVLFHDVAERENGFGVWKLWEELAAQHPSFLFLHEHGLGVLSVGPVVPLALQPLFDATEAEVDVIRDFYSSAGQVISDAYYQGARRDETERLLGEVEQLERVLEAERERRERAEALLQEVTDSFSWSATKPLRWAVGLIPESTRQTLRGRGTAQRSE
jgi:hypothetical protein